MTRKWSRLKTPVSGLCGTGITDFGSSPKFLTTRLNRSPPPLQSHGLKCEIGLERPLRLHRGMYEDIRRLMPLLTTALQAATFSY